MEVGSHNRKALRGPDHQALMKLHPPERDDVDEQFQGVKLVSKWNRPSPDSNAPDSGTPARLHVQRWRLHRRGLTIRERRDRAGYGCRRQSGAGDEFRGTERNMAGLSLWGVGATLLISR